MKRPSRIAGAAGLLLMASIGLSGAQEAGKKSSDLDEIKAMQKAILERLDAQDKVLKDIQQKVQAAAAGQRPQIDPNKVYSIPLGDSAIRGPKDARVTLYEFSDYQ